MARLKSPAKRGAILDAAVHEIARNGLAASTASIAKRAGVASGSLFTYFPDKETLLNELYLELKREVYSRVNADFPQAASLEARARHVWTQFLSWAIESPERRKVSVLLNVSDVLTTDTRRNVATIRGIIEPTMRELGRRSVAHGLPAEFAFAFLSSMQETTLDFAVRQPKRRKELIDRAFQVFWRAIH
jgi:AcrR family transcriptional regulator